MNDSGGPYIPPQCNIPLWLGPMFIIVGIFIAVTNIILIYTIWRTHTLHTNANIFVASLAATDILVSIAGQMSGVYLITWASFVRATHVLQMIIGGMAVGSVWCSLVQMAVISIDRYIYIAHPYVYQRKCTKKTIFRILGVVWICTVVITVVPVVMIDKVPHSGCLVSNLPKEYLIFTCGTSLNVTVLITFCAYGKIAILSIRKRRQISRLVTVVQPIRNDDTHDQGNRAMYQENISGHWKSIKFFILMSGNFLIFVLPSLISITMAQFMEVPGVIINFATVLPVLNSGSNFFICYAMMKDFRGAVKNICGNTCQKTCFKK